MRLADIDILIIPGWTNSGPDHWQSRWERNMRSARRVEQADWDTPICADWEERIVAEAQAARRPTVLVAHSCGVTAVVRAAPRLAGTRVVGAFLVAPSDVAGQDIWIAKEGGFAALPEDPLPFPSKLIGSSTDPYCSVERAQELGLAWGSDVSIIAEAGHINTASGHGPWPEGLLSFGIFLKRLG
ncbi:MAG: alpha/beta hydrolase [Hyphomicrobiaceae bacterium]